MALLCDSCKTTSASLYCKADRVYLCIPCDTNIHVASRHARVWLCEVCEQAPAHVTCKADAAALCVACDRDIHDANPLARRHERAPVAPFYDCVSGKFPSDILSQDKISEDQEAREASWLVKDIGHNVKNKKFLDISLNKVSEAEEAEAASWLVKDEDDEEVGDVAKCADVDLGKKGDHWIGRMGYDMNSDGVVPVRCYDVVGPDVVEGLPAYDLDYPGARSGAGAKPFMYNFTSQSISQSVSSSSLEIEAGIVPDHNAAMADVSNNHHLHNQSSTEVYPTPLVGYEREARVLRYREKRKNRKFEKTIRYASRKAYAETRPRIKGRFAKRTETDDALISPDSSYGVVPSY